MLGRCAFPIVMQINRVISQNKFHPKVRLAMKLKNSILCLLIFFTLLPVCIFGMFSIYEANRKIDEMVEKNLKVASDNQIMNIQNFCRDRSEEMEMIGSYSLIKDAILESLGMSDSHVERSYVDNLLRERKNYGNYVASISVLDKDFHVVGSSEDYDISDISEFKYSNEKFHTGKFFIGNCYERDIDGVTKKVVPSYSGIYQDNTLIGYIAEELDTDYFDELRLNMDSVTGGTFYLLDGNGAIISAGDTKHKDSINKFVTTDKERENFQNAWNAIDHEANPSGEVRYSYNGIKYITYYSNVANTEWGIRITENLSAQRESIHSYTALILISLCLLGISIMYAQHFFAVKLLTPIDKITETFDAIKSNQDYSLRIPVNSKDEMGKLATGINELLDYIESADIEEKTRQRHLRELAERDPLTGVKNKKAIEQVMLSAVQHAEENGEQITIGFVDIDDFKNYNTNYGHQEGDSVIKFVADVLEKYSSGDVGRNGGDEFVFCYTGDRSKDFIENKMTNMLHALNSDYICSKTNTHIPIRCSIGIVTTNNPFDYATLIQKADEAMYIAKENGKNTFHIIEF